MIAEVEVKAEFKGSLIALDMQNGLMIICLFNYLFNYILVPLFLIN